ncbi:MAG: phosphopantetheine-binding protein, partial [Acidobacteria bacterium]|nr:phosphopantetheine-binding protein [Acidobacteriota bacterium]
LYRTGDLARSRADGTLEFLGRLDGQIKLRGFRIELGEIESVLLEAPTVSEAVVVARGEAHASRSIVAYLVATRGLTVDVDELRDLARRKLPDYMVPSAFVVLESLPLTPNGKVDRRALPAPERTGRGLRAEYRAPATPREARLASLFESVFEIRPIGIADDFFELGGNSLTGARLATEIQKAFGRRISPAILLRAPTVQTLARAMDEKAATARWSSLVPIQPEGSLPPLFVLHGGAGTILFYQELARALGQDQPVYGLQARGLYGDAPPQSTVEEMAGHYIQELRTVQPAGPYAMVGFCFGAILGFEMARQLRAAGETVGLLVSLDGGAPHYDYSRDPAPPGSTASAASSSRIAREWKKLASLPRGRRLAYVKEKIGNQWISRTMNAQYRVGEWFRERGRPVPAPLRRIYFLVNHGEAEAKYRPKVYPGRMVIFETAGLFRDRNLGWKDLVGGGLEIHEISGSHRGHRDLLTGEFVKALSGDLTRLLRSAAADGKVLRVMR